MLYKPKGRAAEYAAWAINHYHGCTHGCRYCYAPAVTRKSRAGFHWEASPKLDAPRVLRHQLEVFERRGESVQGGVLMSFLGDPYQPAETELGLTRQMMCCLIDHGIEFTVLTKGGLRACRDFDLLRNFTGASFGTSIVWMDQKLADKWEPAAAPIAERIEAIEWAREQMIPTWVSLEPVIDPDQAMRVIRGLIDVVDFWRIGKINYMPDIEREVDWCKFANEAAVLLTLAGAQYHFKRSLEGYLNGSVDAMQTSVCCGST